MFTHRSRVAAIALAAALLGAAAPVAYGALHGSAPHASPHRGPSAPTAVASTARYVETHLMFGTARPDGGAPVTAAQFRRFVDRVVTPRFPDGLTVDEVRGQYRDRHGVVEHERSYELYLLYPVRETTAADRKIEKIRAVYTRRFAQESVARIDEEAAVDF